MNKNKNPFSAYRIEFPYTCSFSIPEDGHITKVTIETRSEELRYGRNDGFVCLCGSVIGGRTHVYVNRQWQSRDQRALQLFRYWPHHPAINS